MLIGRQIGPFAIDKELGGGAMGAVYRARYAKTGQHVAIKVMAAGLGSSEQALARFEREAAILKQLRHPNIVRLLATGRFQGQPFYAMELIDGESLDRVMERRGRITWEEVVTLGTQLCAALQHAHEKGIVHRDLKPSNLMVPRDGPVKLTDFGIAKDLDVTALTSAHCTVGTAAYMSPEQCKGDRNLTHKSDLYSLGVMLYELLTGRKPFLADTPMDMFLLHVEGKFERPSRLVLDIPVWLDNLVCQLLEKRPEHRPADAATVGAALGQVKEKVEAQKSAGVAAVEARRADRPRDRARPDDADRDAARALQAGLGKLGKVRRRKKSRSFFEQKWARAAGILALLVVIGGALYAVFKPPTADKLLAQIDPLMEPDDPDNYDRAEPLLNEFLNRYATHKEAGRVGDYLDRIKVYREEDSLRKRVNLARNVGDSFKPQSAPEGLAAQAVRYGDFGDLPAAQARWQELKQLAEKEKDNSSLRVWSLLADKKLRELKDKVPADADVGKLRKELLDKKLAEAIDLKAKKQTREARLICQDVLDLYQKEHDAGTAELVQKARELLGPDPK